MRSKFILFVGLGLLGLNFWGCSKNGSGSGGIGVNQSCKGGETLAGPLLSALGKDHLLVGGTMEDDIAASAP